MSAHEAGNRAECRRLDERAPMKNKRFLLLVALAALAAFTLSAHTAAGKSSDRKSREKEEEKDRERKERARKEFRKWRQAGMAIELSKQVSSFADDIEQLNQQVTLTEEQKAKIDKMRGLRDKALESWDKANVKKFDTLKTKLEKLSLGSSGSMARDIKTCKTIVEYMHKLRKARDAIAAGHERKMFATLTAEQRRKWNVPIISENVLAEFEPFDLEEAQIVKIKSLCEAQARKCTSPVNPEAGSRSIEAVKKQVYLRVLTIKQRKEYAATKKRDKATDKKRK